MITLRIIEIGLENELRQLYVFIHIKTSWNYTLIINYKIISRIQHRQLRYNSNKQNKNLKENFIKTN